MEHAKCEILIRIWNLLNQRRFNIGCTDEDFNIFNQLIIESTGCLDTPYICLADENCNPTSTITCSVTLGALQITQNSEDDRITVELDSLSGVSGTPIYQWSFEGSDFQLCAGSSINDTILCLERINASPSFTSTISLIITGDDTCSASTQIINQAFDFCTISATTIQVVDNPTGLGITFDIIGLTGEAPFTYQWNFDVALFQVCEGTSSTDAQLCLDVIAAQNQFNSTISVTITDNKGCVINNFSIGANNISFGPYCNIQLDSIPVEVSSAQTPVDTDIYVFYDATSIGVPDAQAAHNVVTQWFADIQATIPNFVGNLYTIPTYCERWVVYGAYPRTAILKHFIGDAGYPNTFVAQGANWAFARNLPPGVDNNGINNGGFIPSNNVIVLGFVDESLSSYHSWQSPPDFTALPNPFHPGQNGPQVTPTFIEDYGDFVLAHGQYSFFKMLIYPVVTHGQGSDENLLLQALASIKGQLFSALEVTALEAGQNNMVDLSILQIENPYMDYYNNNSLSPLVDLDVEIKPDKFSPASLVFTPAELGMDLNEFLIDNTVEKVTFIANFINQTNPSVYIWTYDTNIFDLISQSGNMIELMIKPAFLLQNLSTSISASITDNNTCMGSLSGTYNLTYNLLGYEDEFIIN